MRIIRNMNQECPTKAPQEYYFRTTDHYNRTVKKQDRKILTGDEEREIIVEKYT